jgi:putative Mg2+ transporter-C (MgtC) family protein
MYMTDTLALEQIILRIALALIAGLIIGFDSWRHQRNAGIRTYCVVVVTSTMTMMLMNSISLNHPDAFSRVLAGMITGLGFFGGGIIMRETDTHRLYGLTTAATIWACGLIGACIGSGHYFISVTGLIGMMLALYVDFDHFVRKTLGIKSKEDLSK